MLGDISGAVWSLKLDFVIARKSLSSQCAVRVWTTVLIVI